MVYVIAILFILVSIGMYRLPSLILCTDKLNFYATVFGGLMTLLAVLLNILYEKYNYSYDREYREIEEEYKNIIQALNNIRLDVYADVYKKVFQFHVMAPYSLIDTYEYTRIINNESHSFRLAVQNIRAFSKFVDFEIKSEYGNTNIASLLLLLSNYVWSTSKYMQDILDAVQIISAMFYNQRKYPNNATIANSALELIPKNESKFSKANTRLNTIIPQRGMLDVLIKELKDYALAYKFKRFKELDQKYIFKRFELMFNKNKR